MKKIRHNSSGFSDSIHYLLRYRFSLIVSLVLAFICVAATVYLPIAVGHSIDAILNTGDFSLADVASALNPAVISAFVLGISRYGMNVLHNRISFRIVHDIRRECFQKIQTLSIACLDKTSTGDIVSRFVTDADRFADGILLGLSQLITGVLTMMATLVIMFIKCPRIALVVMLITPVSLLISKFIAGRTHRYFINRNEKNADLSNTINEMIENIRTVKAYTAEDKVLSAFRLENESLKKASLSATFFSSLVNPTTRLINSAVYAAVAGIGSYSVLMHQMTVGALSVYLNYANQYAKPFNEISGVIAELQSAFASAERLFGFLAMPAEAPDAPTHEIAAVRGDVSFRHVAFGYSDKKTVYRDLSFDVKAGQMIAIVGPTGCGKTTLVNLLMRFYDSNGGDIFLDGVDIQSLSRANLRHSFGMVLQDTWLLVGTIRDNLKLGNAEASDEMILECCRKTHADAFISLLPKGLDTEIDESGGILSDGQKQLLCITRVMVANPPILILDEATSALDTRTEMLVQEAMNELSRGRTSFVIAHRLSTIESADRILVFDNGEIVEEGTHKELLGLNGSYAALFAGQFSHS